jgi:CRISPR system Cascade subunit CasA
MSEIIQPEFNLIDEPWIRVSVGSEIKTVGLRGVFENAHNYDGLAGELPTQNFAVLRLLLAIMYASLYVDLPTADDAIELWEDLYHAGRFDIKLIGGYLEQYRGRFFLFDEKYPFYQVAEISGTTGYARKLNGEIAESGSNPEPQKARIFSTYAGKAKNELSYGDAARWLLHLNGYDDTSGKQSKETKSVTGKLDSAGAGWLGQIGGVYVKGSNLFETLLLNFAVLDHNEKPWHLGQAVWEKPVKSDERSLIVKPEDPLTLFTLQSRRILLKRNDGKVTGYRTLGGDYFVKRNADKVIAGAEPFAETMTIWNETAKAKGETLYMPRRHYAGKLMWTSLDFFLLRAEDKNRPGVIENLRILEEMGIYDSKQTVIAAVGMIYGDKDTSAADVYSDELTFDPKILMEDLGADWLTRISAELQSTDSLVRSYTRLAAECYLASGGDEGNNRTAVKMITDSARADAYALLDIPFREWLASVNASDDIDQKSALWQETAKRIIHRAGQRLVERYNLQLCKVRGKGADTGGAKGGKQTVNIYMALNTFESRIRGGMKKHE